MDRFPLQLGVFKNLETLTSNEGLRALLNKLAANFGWPDSRWEDVRVPLTTGRIVGATNPPTFAKYTDNGAGSVGVWAWSFAVQGAGNEEQIWFHVQFPHAYKLGTTIHPHLHWGIATAGSAGEFVKWGLEYTWTDIGGDFPVTAITTTDASTAAAATVQGDDPLVVQRHYMSAFPDISGSAIEGVSSMLLGRLFRNSAHADDDLAQLAFAFEIDFHVEKDSIGSRLEYVK
jgi:hypothetical protein